MSGFIHGLTVFGFAALGALLPEVLRWVACLRSDNTPSRREVLASLLLVAVGGLGVAILLDPSGLTRLQTAVLGAAFPQTFSSAVAAISKPPEKTRGLGRARTLVDYLSWRLH